MVSNDSYSMILVGSMSDSLVVQAFLIISKKRYFQVLKIFE